MRHRTSPFKRRHDAPDLILLCVRWYCRYSLSYPDLGEMMRERGLAVDHVTIFRRVRRYAPGINKRMRPYLRVSGTSCRIDETYAEVSTEWKYLYRAVDSAGCTIEFMLSARRNVSAAERFFKKLMRADHRRLPFTVGTGKRTSYPEAFAAQVSEKVLRSDASFHTAERAIEGIEASHMMMRSQLKMISREDAVGQLKFVGNLFGVAA